MKTPLFKAIKGVMQSAGQWLTETPERALDDAYDAALRIRAIENEHFNGQRISPESAGHSDSVQAYFQAELNKNLSGTERLCLQLMRGHDLYSRAAFKMFSDNAGFDIGP